MEMPETEEAMDDLRAILSKPLAGEKRLRWAIMAGEDTSPTFLPTWMKTSIDKKICEYLETWTTWRNRFEQRAARGFDDLTPTMKKRFEEF